MDPSTSPSTPSPLSPTAPLIFSNALHVAVDQGAVDVTRLLLKYGLEPNQGGRLSCPRLSSHSEQGFFAGSCPDASRSPSTGTTKMAVMHPLPPAPPTPHPQRRVSWVAPGTPGQPGRGGLRHVPRQRSLSLEHDKAEQRRPAADQRSVSLKSSPLLRAKAPGQGQAHGHGDNGSVVELWDAPGSPPGPGQRPKASVDGASAGLRPHPTHGSGSKLRRSSEIFKSILLNLSMRDAEAAGAETPGNATPPELEAPQVDLAGLLAAHERRRLAATRHLDDSSASSSMSSSSSDLSVRSSSDDECEGLATGAPHHHHALGLGLGLGYASDVVLHTNPGLAAERLGALASYTRQYLFSLPALFLAVARGHTTMVYLLLKYGANVDFQVSRAPLCRPSPTLQRLLLRQPLPL
ncbi:hypothetical protein ONE63_008999 [Megalurothrips usitatus]|uniref:Uncharacterized protein n=1 Tax=Megalurothrips usitatus TaxID=439358 RepID=A0AAV7XLX0_9NEOP|nr:hypothetical protein ONE63_008999 [Megalurothrips usitatus]